MFNTSINIKTLLPALALSFMLACSGEGPGKSDGPDDPPPPPPPTVTKMGYFRQMKADAQPIKFSEDSNNKKVTMHYSRKYHSSVVLPTGKVLIVGGYSDDVQAPARRLEIFDPSEERFYDTGVDISPRVYPGVVSISDTEVAIIGGLINVPVEIYDSSSGTLTRTFNLVNESDEFPGQNLGNVKTCWKYPDSNVVVVITLDGNIVEADLDKKSWTLMAKINKGGFGLAKVNESFYFIGGISYQDPTQSGDRSIIRYNTDTKELSVLDVQLATKRFGCSAAKVLTENKIGIYGGSYFPTINTDPPVYITDVEVLDLTTQTISTVGKMVSSAQNDYAVQLQNGFVVHLGGFKSGSPTSQELFYDPATNTSGVTGDMTLRRVDHNIILLPTGRVLVTGGVNGVTTTASAEIYEPEHKLYVVMPKDTCAVGQQLQFSVEYVTSNVSWQLVSGAGLIDQTGLYSAPMEMPKDAQVVIKVSSNDDPTIFALVRITLVN